jgi:outer membrane protein TolC
LTTLILCLSPGPSAATWSLDRVLDVTRGKDPGVSAARAAGDVGRAQAALAWARLLPHVALSAGVTRSDDPAMLFSEKLWQGRFTAADFALDRLNEPATSSAIQWGLSVSQPLWNAGSEFAAPGLASHRARAADAAQRDAVAERLLAAVETYTAAIRAREDARASEQALAAATALRDAAVERYRMGQVPELDTLRAEARYEEARARDLGAQRGVTVALERLSLLIETPVAPDELEAPADLAPVPDTIHGTRGDLAAARENSAAANTEARIAALHWLPALNFRFSATDYRPDLGTPGKLRWMAGVFADLPVFDGGQRVNERRAARARASLARANATSLERDHAVALAGARAEDAVARERRGAARAGRAAAEEALRLASMRYRSGLVPLSELLATDSEASNARAAEVEASAATILAHYRLLRAIGELQ